MSRFGKLVYEDGGGKLVYADASGKLVYADTAAMEYGTPALNPDLSRYKEGYGASLADAVSAMHTCAWTNPVGPDPDVANHYTFRPFPDYYARCSAIRWHLGRRDANNATLTKYAFSISEYVNTGGGKMYVGYRTDETPNDDWSWVTCANKVEITGVGAYELPINEYVTSGYLWILVWQEDTIATDDKVVCDTTGRRLHGE
jgi:hypothetical protein